MKCLKNFKPYAINTVLIYTALLLLLVFGFSSCTNHQKSEATQYITDEPDSQFLVYASEIDLAEIQLGQLAQQKGTFRRLKN